MVRPEDYLKASLDGDFERMDRIVKQLVDDRDTTLIKCLTCGEIVAFEKTAELISTVLWGGSNTLTYLILKHIQNCPGHNVVIPTQIIGDYPMSRILEKKIKETWQGNGVDFDSWFPTYVERRKEMCLTQR